VAYDSLPLIVVFNTEEGMTERNVQAAILAWLRKQPVPAPGTPERSVLDELLAAWKMGSEACEKAYLTRRTGLVDRAVRNAVEELRAREWPIMASSGQADGCEGWNR